MRTARLGTTVAEASPDVAVMGTMTSHQMVI
jgi:hypothetical protein